jgi:hypothetical protein
VSTHGFVYFLAHDCVHCPDTPNELKKSLANVLALQGQIESVEIELNRMQGLMKHETLSAEATTILKNMEDHYTLLKSQVDALFTALNVSQDFPEVKGATVEFLQTLLLARDLKANIRKRAVGSFHEWDCLDQAVGGKANPLGMQKQIKCID